MDDIIDGGSTLSRAVEELRSMGARKIYYYSTHGLFTKDCIKKIKDSKVEEVLVTNSIPLDKEK